MTEKLNESYQKAIEQQELCTKLYEEIRNNRDQWEQAKELREKLEEVLNLLNECKTLKDYDKVKIKLSNEIGGAKAVENWKKEEYEKVKEKHEQIFSEIKKSCE